MGPSFWPNTLNARNLAAGLALAVSVTAPSTLPAAERHPAPAPQPLIALPEKSWGVGLALDGFRIAIDDIKADGRRYVMAVHPDTGATVMVTLERMRDAASTAGCIARLEHVAKSPAARRSHGQSLTTSSRLPSLEYTVPALSDGTPTQRHVHLCYEKEDVYLDLHLAKPHYTTADEQAFRDLVQTLHIDPMPPASPPTHTRARQTGSSQDLFAAGTQFYLQANYPQAILLYQEALDLEKADPQLDRILWRTLVDNLGMAYNISGKLALARTIFQYGIAEDHTYPMFHYHLACTFAELDDRDRAMSSLRTAFEHRRNLNPGQAALPDPRREPPFRRFMAQDDFRRFAAQLAARTK